jgi:uncharacterized protein (DUF302 family)
MIYTVNSQKALNDIDCSLRDAAQRHKFGILNVLDIKQTLFAKGIEIGQECRIYDVCNPQAASQALTQNMAISAVLPCRISVFSEGDGIILATVRPTDLMRATGLSGVEALALDIEREIVAIMDESAK